MKRTLVYTVTGGHDMTEECTIHESLIQKERGEIHLLIHRHYDFNWYHEKVGV